MKRWIPLLLIAILSACQTGPRPIAYGTDGCHFCRMTIVDRQHAAELVTDKGKVYKFDATECMINYLREVPGVEMAHYLVTDFANPGGLTDAREASYLISENLPSPMGAYLTAFAHPGDAREALARFGGELYDWQQVRKTINP
ncbi:nitrous oxide reductase accessory protein NosL [Robiginitalea sp. SC105]|uniref:nitrous oxide reductase accessory protein NosL n=1 Tax=Robiginitalea sp. SC105 TaxID=2762332 RepID=UPI00163A3C1B|nr:nitrous oxide reductase accessory protein NosL [Robiginitalea sp. SC105]MBC2839290.1 nitrous oxide reductase accessory protein NosL [Robiginitalea sp. SC105]